MAQGGIIPSELFLSIIPPFFAHESLAHSPLLLSSVGRLPEEVSTVERATKDSSHPIKAVIVLDLDEPDVWRHYEISQQLHDRGSRADDNKESLIRRLLEYAKTKPVIEHYAHQNVVIHIDDTKSVDEVTQEIIDALYTFAKNS
jgi:adenylate kinase family enzyme